MARSGRWLPAASAAVLALVVGAGVGTSTGSGCEPRDLFIRSLGDANGNAMPVDISQVPGDPLKYTAAMDYGMKGFQLEASAAPAASCVAKLPGAPVVMVDAGSSALVEVSLLNSDSGSTSTCQVNVSRLSGKETILKSVTIKGAYLVPEWSSTVRSYAAYLDLNRDLIEVVYVPVDNGQVVSLSAQPEVLPSKTSGTSAGRRLAGQSQHNPATFVSTIDAGRTRLVEMPISSADRSAHDKYSFQVQRPACPAEQRFFDGAARTCTDVCNEGYFGNHATGRCTPCLQSHCLVCDGGVACTACEDHFFLRSGGCHRSAEASAGEVLGGVGKSAQSFVGGHPALVYSAGSAFLAALVAATVGICYRDRCLRARNPRLLDSDDEELVSFRDYDSRRQHYDD